MPIWKFFCPENRHPGLWQGWLENHCVAVGWPPGQGFPLEGPAVSTSWQRARDCLTAIEVGHHIVVHLPGRRFGRVGEVAGTATGDGDWEPLVPPADAHPHGELGRRVFVEWDNAGPVNGDWVVQVPQQIRFPTRDAVRRMRTLTWPEIVQVMNDQGNWVGL